MLIRKFSTWFRSLDFKPILQKETRTTARSVKFHLFLLLMLAASSALLVVLLHNKDSFSGGSGGRPGTVSDEIGLLIFRIIYVSQVTAIAFAIPAYAAGAISNERFRKTFDLLILTALKPADIIVGKYLAVLVDVGLFTAAFLPLTAVCVPMGAVDPQMVVWFYLYLIANASITTMLCIAISAGTRNTITATVSCYLATFALTFIWIAPAMPDFERHSILSINTFGVIIAAFLYTALFYAIAVALIQPRPFFIPVVGDLAEKEIQKRLSNQ